MRTDERLRAEYEPDPNLRMLKIDQCDITAGAAAIARAEEVRAWYHAWHSAWIACQSRGVVCVERSSVWIYLTGQARMKKLRADPPAMEAWLQDWAGEPADAEVEF